jgi:hypothetical protein
MANLEEKIVSRLDKIDENIRLLTSGQSSIESRVSSIERQCHMNNFGEESQTGSSWRQYGGVDSRILQSEPPISSEPPLSPDVQGEFQSIKDSVQKVQLPPEYRVNDAGNRSGIKKTDQVWANSIARSARYVETSLKLMASASGSSASSDIKQEDVEKLFVVQLAHIKFLQEEFQSVLVKGMFDENTGRVFRTLQKNTSPLSPEAVQTLRNTTQIVQAQAIIQQNQSYQHHRGSGYRGPGGFRGGYRGGNRFDRYQSFTNRSFSHFSPRGRGSYGFNQHGNSSGGDFRNQDIQENSGN